MREEHPQEKGERGRGGFNKEAEDDNKEEEDKNVNEDTLPVVPFVLPSTVGLWNKTWI